MSSLSRGSLVVAWRGQSSAGYQGRNALIATDCTHLLRVAARSSRTYGSGWTADEAQRLGRLVVRERL
jgi:hypothetical protein